MVGMEHLEVNKVFFTLNVVVLACHRGTLGYGVSAPIFLDLKKLMSSAPQLDVSLSPAKGARYPFLQLDFNHQTV